MKTYLQDFGLWLFAIIALACLIVSAPATFTLVSLFHNDGSPYAFYATIAVVAILEAGAVASKIATLFVPDARRALNTFCIAALSVNAISNYIFGVHVASAHLQGIALPAGAIVYAAFVPVLLYLMLHQFVRRVAHLRRDATDVQLAVARTMQPVQETVEQFAYLMQALQTMQNAMQKPVHIGASMHPTDAPAMHSTDAPAAPDAPAMQPDAPKQIEGPPESASVQIDAPAESASMQLTCIKCNAPLAIPDGKDAGRYRSATARYGCEACKPIP